jgi:BirA family biotin operon repressor/biotin-[acetyl-CoA-carboxylase] ligase
MEDSPDCYARSSDGQERCENNGNTNQRQVDAEWKGQHGQPILPSPRIDIRLFTCSPWKNDIQFKWTTYMKLDHLSPETLNNIIRVNPASPWKIVRLSRVTSTQKVARDYALSGCAAGTVIVAETQTEGRGRHGRKWHSVEGGLYLTAVLKPVSRAGLVPLLAGIAVAEAIKTVTGIKAGLKWPNDILIGGRKVGGVIVDSSWFLGEVRFILLGIGANINNPLPEALPKATSLSLELGKGIDIDRFLHILIERLDYNLTNLDTEPDEILKSWRRLTQTLGKHVEVVNCSGEVVRGMAVDVDSDGALILENCGRRRRVVSGRLKVRYN